MKYDFTSLIDRRGMDALAVDGLGTKSTPGLPEDGFDLIPMWVADMNFSTAPAVTEAISRRLAHPLFGYYSVRDEYFDSIIRWQSMRNGVTGLEHAHIGYENGVLGGVASTLRVICPPGGNILIHSPTYSGFVNTLTDAGYNLVYSPLIPDADGIYRMDFADMEAKLAAGDIHAALICSPHNPTGRVWERWELEGAMALFEKYDIPVISDEIWSDIILDGHRHIPTQSVSEDARMRTAAFYSPSKTFNLAGLSSAYHIIYNQELKEKVVREGVLTHYNKMNVFSMYALLGAYSAEGEAWTDEMRTVIKENIDYVCNFITENFPLVRFSRPQGTYMLFLDCAEYMRTRGCSLDDVLRAGYRVGIAWHDGRHHRGDTHIRVNLALPHSLVREAVRRMREYVFV